MDLHQPSESQYLEEVVQGCSVKKGVLRNFTKFSGKRLCQSLFFNKVVGLRLLHRCFPVNFVKFLRTPFYIEHIWWLLLNIHIDTAYLLTTRANYKKFFQKTQ